MRQRVQALDQALSRKPVAYLPGFRSGHWWKRVVALLFYLWGLEGIREGLILRRPDIVYLALTYLALCIILPYAFTVYRRYRASRPPRATAFTPTNVLFPGSNLLFTPAGLSPSWASLFQKAMRKNEMIVTVPLSAGRPAAFATESNVRWNGALYVVDGLRRVRLLKLRRQPPDLYVADYQPLTDQPDSVDRAYLIDLAKAFVRWAQQFPELSWSFGVASDTDPSSAVNTMCNAIFFRRPEASWLLGVDNLGERANAVARELAQFGYTVVQTASTRPAYTPAQAERGPEPPSQTPVPSGPKTKTVDDVVAELDAMVGLESVKAQVKEIKNSIAISKRRVAAGLDPIPLNQHLIFAGPPGTGKTTVARIYGELLAAMGVLHKGQFVAASRADLVGAWQGHTEENTTRKFNEALGGVLFIDEAYSLVTDDRDTFGQIAVNLLNDLMEKNRDSVAVILAGYSDRMRAFLKANEGLPARFDRTIAFPNYTTSELVTIFENLAGKSYDVSDAVKAAVFSVLESIPRGESFGNAREVRRLYEQAQRRQARRLGERGGDLTDSDLRTLLPEDVIQETAGAQVDPARVDSLLTELDGMVGLAAVKRKVKELQASIAVEQRRKKEGRPVGPVAQHLIFAGPPGTGKTTVANIYGELLAAMGVLSQGQVIVASRSDLVSDNKGGTALKTEGIFERALGGVLFIDEAYALKTDYSDSVGQEAIDRMLTLMEENRDKVVVIAAGYSDRMEGFLATNPGLASRFTGTIEFPDYSSAELQTIFKALAMKSGIRLTPETEVAVREFMDRLAGSSDFGNARGVRNLYEEARRKLNVRVHENQNADTQTMFPEDVLAVETLNA